MRLTKVILPALILSAGSVFSSENKPNKQGPTSWRQAEPLNDCSCGAYNIPASIDVSGDWNVHMFTDVSFIYWLAQEEGLKLGFIAAVTDDSSPNGYTDSTTTSYLLQSSDYKPGFKIGVGFVDHHEWVWRADYTWYRAENTTHAPTVSAPIPLWGDSGATGTEVWYPSSWFIQDEIYGPNLSSNWKLGLQLLDGTVSRPYYLGKRAITTPFWGLRGAWIRQSLAISLTESPINQSVALTAQPIHSMNHSNCWSVGPRAGVGSSLLLPLGFQLEGNFAASLLYTRYTTISHSEETANVDNLPISVSYPNYDCLRPSAEFGLGCGWGTYCFKTQCHFQLSADYEFMIFWSQNMMRYLVDSAVANGDFTPNNLYLQGLTITSRFDF